MKEIIFLIIVLIFAGLIFLFNKERNAVDFMFANTTFAIVILFMIGILDSTHWDKIVYALSAVAIGNGLMGVLQEWRKNKWQTI